jgi:SPP1 family holin
LKISKGTIVRLIVFLLALFNQALQSSGRQVIPVDNAAIADFVSYVFTLGAAAAGFWKNNSFSTSAMFGDKQMKIYKSLTTLAKTGVISKSDVDVIMDALYNAGQSVLAGDIISSLTDTTKTNAEKAQQVAKQLGNAILDTTDIVDTSGSAETKAGINKTPIE